MRNSLKNKEQLKVLFTVILILVNGTLFSQCYIATLSEITIPDDPDDLITTLEYPLSGGTKKVMVNFPQGGCENPTITVANYPIWVYNPSSGNPLTISCHPSYTGSDRTGSIDILVNGDKVKTVTIAQKSLQDDDDDTPPVCTVSLPSINDYISMNPLGETRQIPISFSSDCTNQSPLSFSDQSTGDSLPNWITITETPDGKIEISCLSNNTQFSRSFVMFIKNNLGDVILAELITQLTCVEFKEYPDSDGDGLGDILAPPITCLDIKDPNITYVTNNDDYCPYTLGPITNQGCPIGQLPENMNWVASKGYDITGQLKASSKGYFNELGKPIQSQIKDFKTGKTWASETQYDVQGRPGLQTYSAPMNITGEFKYNPELVKTPSDSLYKNAQWENENGTISPVGNQSNTLGHYYSTSNTGEPYQDITKFPISKTTYSTLNPGTVLKVEGGHQYEDNLPQGFRYTVPAAQELYYVFGLTNIVRPLQQFNLKREVKYNKSITIDAENNENVQFTDGEGKVLAVARSGGTQKYEVISTIGEQGYVDIHVPVGIVNSDIELLGNPSDYKVFNLRTEEDLTTSSSMTGGNIYRITYLRERDNKDDFFHWYLTGSNPINVNAEAKGVRYKVNYYDYALNYYDKSGRLIKSTQPLGFNATCLDGTIQYSVNHNLASTFKYDALGRLIETTSPDEGTAKFKYRKDGQIRYSQNSKQDAVNAFSYTNYDNLGRPIESGVVNDFDPNAFENSHPDEDLGYQFRSEIYTTTYDFVDASELASFDVAYRNPSFLSGNVAKTSNDQTTTYYSYDIYGRVQWIVQNISGLGIKTIDYQYDAITSAVNKVIYQKHTPAEYFEHRYTYNTVDNSLVKVETSKDGNTYTEHATYAYYETGALKNVNLAEGIQQIDYVYNLSGQLKAINHPNLDSASDPGGNANDLFGMSIDYFEGDYKRSSAFSNTTGGIDQYNGNIKGITWKTDYNNTASPVQYTYKYNRENWLTEASFKADPTTIDDHVIIDFVADPNVTIEATNSITFITGAHITAITGSSFDARIAAPGTSSSPSDYKVHGITYDANGNIQTLNRNKDNNGGSNLMDALTYTYDPAKPNQLKQVEDAITTPTNANDIKTQNPNNYVYNSIGQLITNIGEDISYMYNASGLVTQIKKTSTNRDIVKFKYNDKNHRVTKESFNPITGARLNTTYYIRDASGTPLAIYENGILVEHTIYGASRLGVHKRQGGINSYQLTDHLGNVRAVVIKSGTNAAALTAKTDYYPFGMPMPNRGNVVGADRYRYAFQGQEKDTETGMEAFELRLWDARIGRWLTTDPMHEFSSPYLGMGNNPINLIDPDGGMTDCPDCPEGYENAQALDEVHLVYKSDRVKLFNNLGYSWKDIQFRDHLQQNNSFYFNIVRNRESRGIYNSLTSNGVNWSGFKDAFNAGSTQKGGTGIAEFWAGFASITIGGALLAPISSLGGLQLTFTGFGRSALANGGLNAVTQLSSNGGSFSKINVLDVGFSALTTGTVSTILSSSFELSYADGFKVNSLKDIGIGIIADQAKGAVHGKFGKLLEGQTLTPTIKTYKIMFEVSSSAAVNTVVNQVK